MGDPASIDVLRYAQCPLIQHPDHVFDRFPECAIGVLGRDARALFEGVVDDRLKFFHVGFRVR